MRFYQFIPELERRGWSVTVSAFFSDGDLEDLYAGRRRRVGSLIAAALRRLRAVGTARRFDVVWLEYEVWPWLPFTCETRLFATGVPVVVDYDDAIFHRYDLHGSVLVRSLLGAKIDRVMAAAAVVVCGNDYIADRARRAGARRVELLPTVVDPERYDQLDSSAGRPFTVGWIGSPSTASYLHLVEESLRDVCGAGQGRVVLVGSGPVTLAGVPLEVRPWAEETEAAEVASFDVGIMPLPDTPWERGKCGYKLIQYMAAGKPVVASPVGVNRSMVDEGVNGLLAAGSAEWTAALAFLRDDAAARRRMGAAGRRRVEETYGLSAISGKLAAILEGAARRRS
jgi:glycosyltransferase involved in cell wall biosynthesis